MTDSFLSKGGLISESFSLWLKSQKEVLAHNPPKEKMVKRVIRHLCLEDLSQSEKKKKKKATFNDYKHACF